VNFFFFVILFLVSLPGTLLNAPVGNNANEPNGVPLLLLLLPRVGY
jgi:hypothetical protein